MSSFHYAFIFPGIQCSLVQSRAISILTETFVFDDVGRKAVEVDDHGHLEYVGATISIYSVDECLNLLNNDCQFLVECRNRSLFFICSFAPRYKNPHMVLAWPVRIFGALDDNEKASYITLLRRIARECGGRYVVLVNDPPDYFEDSLEVHEDHAVLHSEMPNGNAYDILAVWIAKEAGDGSLVWKGRKPDKYPETDTIFGGIAEF